MYRHAVELGLSGFVCNDASGVLIEVEGHRDLVAQLCRLIADSPPPLAKVASITAWTIPVLGQSGQFTILPSDSKGSPSVPVSVDTATCDACLAEVEDPSNRRYQYPFTNCTDCGPRYTIVIRVPYDRPATTMSRFIMCDLCQREYDDPGDRRFHAQPNACPTCGPSLYYLDPAGNERARRSQALELAVEELEAGGIVAIKGIGGYHLAGDATSATAIAKLRSRKSRDEKPFAVMVQDLATASRLCRIDEVAKSALTSYRRPIVLAPLSDGADAIALAAGVAPGLPELGIMLPYSPLHHLLMKRLSRPLVMTSGNVSDDPIAHTDRDALARLGPLVDGLLCHDRTIHIRCDDSVVRATGDGIQVIRRSRGYAPEPLSLGRSALRQAVAVGAEMKSTVSVVKDAYVIASHHIGDLEHLGNFQSFVQALEHLSHLYGVDPSVMAHDMHPEYLSTKHALDTDLELWPIQHHHAHVASCLAEHQHYEAVLGLAFDGLGFGTDGTLWGGEFLIADMTGFSRVGSLYPVVMPGGVASIKEPWRMALSWVTATVGRPALSEIFAGIDSRWPVILELIENRNGPVTTSAGRLFDAVSALLGLRSMVTYEGQAAIALEAAAATVPRDRAPCYPVKIIKSPGSTATLDPRPLIEAVIEDRNAGCPLETIAAGFHEGLGIGAASLAASLARANNLSTVVLTGGVFQNSRLTNIVCDALQGEGLRVLVHAAVPPNDGGISIGQAALAALSDHPPSERPLP